MVPVAKFSPELGSNCHYFHVCFASKVYSAFDRDMASGWSLNTVLKPPWRTPSGIHLATDPTPKPQKATTPPHSH